MIAPELLQFARSFPDPVLLLAGDGRVVFANVPAAELVGQPGPEALAGRALSHLVTDPADKLQAYLRIWARSPQPLPGALTFAGRVRPVDCRCHGWLLQPSVDGGPIVCIRPLRKTPSTPFHTLNGRLEELAREVAARRRSDALLSGQKRVLELIARDAPLTDVLNELALVVEGLSEEGLLVSILLVDADEQHLRFGAGPSFSAEYRLAVDGLPVGPGTSPCGVAAYRREPVVVGDLTADPAFEDYATLARGFGVKACWSVPILSSHGKVLGTFGLYCRTTRKPVPSDWQMVEVVTRTAAIAIDKARAEQERQVREEALRRAEKLAAAGRLAATIAHEINNPLEAVTNLLFLVSSDKALPEEARQYLAAAEFELARVAHIARQTLGFYRESPSLDWADISVLLQEILALYRSKIQAKGLSVQTDYGPTPPLRCRPGEIRQVFANLIGNAIDAMEEGGSLTVCAAPAGERELVITIRDTGVGIRPKDLERMFEPFFTTKKGFGTGLGLWVAKEIVEKHAGRIEVESSTGPERRGTTFRVVLPVNGKEKSTSQAA